MATLIAFDTATERMTIALRCGERVLAHEGEGGARASTTLLAAIVALLGEAGVRVGALDAIAFGRGPGAFTGLRTACSVAQGLAFGAGKGVLPIDTLLAIAEDARGDAPALRIWALLDARMDQIYAAEYEYADGHWATRVAPLLSGAEALSARWRAAPADAVAGQALAVFGPRLQTGAAIRHPEATPNARALLRLAERAWADGAAVDPVLALPLYVRDKVAKTEAERAGARSTSARSTSVCAGRDGAAASPLRSALSDEEGRVPPAPAFKT